MFSPYKRTAELNLFKSIGLILNLCKITRLTCVVMLHNQPAMKVSMVIQGKRYSQGQCSVQYSCEILWSLENECSFANNFRTSGTLREMQKCSSNCDVIS